jgi:hypothetical protein
MHLAPQSYELLYKQQVMGFDIISIEVMDLSELNNVMKAAAANNVPKAERSTTGSWIPSSISTISIDTGRVDAANDFTNHLQPLSSRRRRHAPTGGSDNDRLSVMHARTHYGIMLWKSYWIPSSSSSTSRRRRHRHQYR